MKLYRIQDYFNPNKILDIGANKGQFHKIAQKAFPNSFIFSIEASAECEVYLKTITKNYYIGLLAKDNSQYSFYSRIGDPTATGNSIYKELTQFYSDEKLNIISQNGVMLDDLMETDSQFDLIKIDTQGSELDIISGGLNICKKAKGILLEVSLTQYNEGAPLYDDVILFMQNLGFRKEVVLCEIRNRNTHQQDILFINSNLKLTRRKFRLLSLPRILYFVNRLSGICRWT